MGLLVRAAGALLLAALTLLQSAYFGGLEWSLLAVSPVVFHAIHRWIRAKSAAQFAKPVYVSRGTFWFTELAFLVFMAATFVSLASWFASATQTPYLDRVHALQVQWDGAQSWVVKWILDVGAYAQAAQELIATVAGDSYRKALAFFFFAPLTVFGALALAYSGASFP
ncbi:MAG: hypothetical protein IPH37_14665 [Burkholderiales bacterium]|nr:hypothetical protein [Burkholderiales bacterium]